MKRIERGRKSSSCSGIFMKSISIRRNAEWIWIQVRGVRLGDDRRATISWNFAGERYSAELAKHLTNMKAFKQRGSRATIPPPTSKEMPNRVSLKCSSQLGEQSGRTWNYLGIAQTESSSPRISLVPSYGNLISIYDYNFSSIFYRILFLNAIKCIFDSSIIRRSLDPSFRFLNFAIYMLALYLVMKNPENFILRCLIYVNKPKQRK